MFLGSVSTMFLFSARYVSTLLTNTMYDVSTMLTNMYEKRENINEWISFIDSHSDSIMGFWK